MGRRRKQGPARPQSDASAPPGDEAAEAALDDLAGSGGGGDIDGDEALLDAGEAELDGEPGDVSSLEAVAEVEDGPAADDAQAPVVPDAPLADTPAPPAPAEAAKGQGDAADAAPGAHPAPAPRMPALRRGHVFARVRGTVALMATGYTLDGERRTRWKAGEEAQFRRVDVESLPEHFEELS